MYGVGAAKGKEGLLRAVRSFEAVMRLQIMGKDVKVGWSRERQESGSISLARASTGAFEHSNESAARKRIECCHWSCFSESKLPASCRLGG